MSNTKEVFRGLATALTEPSEENNLTPVTMRVSLYGFLLSGILYLNAQTFDATELIAVISFVSVAAIVEVMYRKLEVGKRLIWSFVGLILLISFISLLLVQATQLREAWYRVNVADKNIARLTLDSPFPIISANSNGIIENLNTEASKLTEWTNTEAKGKSLAILMRPEKVSAHETALARVRDEIIRDGKPVWIPTGNRVFRIKTKSGKFIDANIQIVGVPFKPMTENGVYPDSKDVGFYAFVVPRPIVVERKDK
jgi:PAS domain S-box-containing protein